MMKKEITRGEVYYVEILRTDLSGFEGRVSNEEVGGSIFIDNEQVNLQGNLVNLAKFAELEPIGSMLDTRPRFFHLGKAPDNKKAEWSGVVLLNNVLTSVEMFRESLPATKAAP